MTFTTEQAVDAANQALKAAYGRPLTDVEMLVLKGALERDSYDQIAARNQYSTSYISQDIAPKLWKLLSDATGEKVKKNSLKEPLKRYWETLSAARSPVPPDLTKGGMLPAGALSVSADAVTLPYPTYIRHPAIEELCLETLMHHPGTLIRIKSPKLTGKTSLINFLLGMLAAQGIHTINLSLRLADRQRHFNDIDIFLRWFCFSVEQELGLESELNRYWNAEFLGSKVSCTTYFEKYLLRQDEAPVVLCIDDIDVLFAYPHIYEDFYGLLRSWYEKARSRDQWRKLHLVLAHSTEAYIRLNINQSPFNVGLPIELPELSPAQASHLAQRMGLAYAPAAINQLIALLGGHPFLLTQAFDYLKNADSEDLAAFLASAPTQSGIYRSHLQELWQELKHRPLLEVAFATVIAAGQPVSLEPTLAYQLQSMGLIHVMGNLAEVSCQLYRQYFQANLQASEGVVGGAPDR